MIAPGGRFDYASRMRRTLIAANWKMHPAPAGFDAKDSPYRTRGDCDVVVFPALPDLPRVRAAELLYGGQCGRPETHGAFTGDCSMAMLKEAGCRYVLCGHSERRQGHGESDAFVMEQVVAALALGMHPVLCVGETSEERSQGKTHDVLKRQLHGLPDSPEIVVAYEPVWAIGTGEAAEPQEIAEAHACIRGHLPQGMRPSTRIVYGGSADAANAAALLAINDIDGLLVGGASLKPAAFAAMVALAAA